MSNHFDNARRNWDTDPADRMAVLSNTVSVLAHHGNPKGNDMSDGRNSGQHNYPRAMSGNVTTLAERALTLVASNTNVSRSHPDPNLIATLIKATLDTNEETRHQIIQDAVKSGVSPAVLVDIYIPAIARILGDEWFLDNASFADVTIGTARLQAMVRDLDDLIEHRQPHAGVLMIVLENCYHTLGAVVATSQLRRNGISVRLSIGQNAKTIKNLFETSDFDAVMISASLTARLEIIRNLVKHIRNKGNGSTPVVIGGTILEQQTDVKTLTGADYTLTDPIKAAEQCGLMNQYAGGGDIPRPKGR